MSDDKEKDTTLEGPVSDTVPIPDDLAQTAGNDEPVDSDIPVAKDPATEPSPSA